MRISPIRKLILTASALGLLLCSCNQPSSQENEISFAKKDSIIPPIIIKATNPKITLLDTCVPPRKIAISSIYSSFTNSKSSSRYGLTPFINPADFYITMENFDTEEGLALSSITCGFKDSKDRLWFGTSGNGLNLYDGTKFITFNSSHGLIHNLIHEIYEDKEGTLWIGTYGGLSKYDGATFVNYTTEEGLIHNDINCILQDTKGRLWVGTSEGLSCLVGDKIKNYPISNNNGTSNIAVLNIVEDHKNNILFGTNEGLYYLEKEGSSEEKIVHYPKVTIDEVIFRITEDKSGNLWLGTENGVYKYSPNQTNKDKSSLRHFTTEDGLAHNDIFSITEDSKGNIWIGTDGGVSRYNNKDTTKSKFYTLTTKQGLANNLIRDITEDASGNLWFSTYGNGLNRYPGDAVTSYTEAQGLKGKTISSICADTSSSIWLVSFSGFLTHYDGEKFTNYNFTEDLGGQFFYDIIKDSENNLWVATDDGIFNLTQNYAIHYTTQHGLLAEDSISMLQDAAGNLWIGSYEAGINKFDGNTITAYTTEDGLVHNTVWSSIEDKDGMLWFATRGGLSRFNGETFTNFTKEQGLVENKLSKIIQDSKGNLIIGSWGSGVSIVLKENIKNLTTETLASNNTSYFKNFNKNNGLANDVVYDIEEDSKGNIFIGSSKGITVFKGGIDSTGKNFAKDGIENYNQTTGYSIKDLANNHSMFMDSDDILWLGTGDKLVKFDYSEIQKNTKPPNVIIEQIKVNNEKVSWRLLEKFRSKTGTVSNKNISVESFVADELMVYNKSLSQIERDSLVEKFKHVTFESVAIKSSIPNNLVLPYSNNNISFDFVGVETSRPSLVKYQYKLEGYDEDWNPITTTNTANFGNIPHGIHTFMVKAQSPDGVWSKPLYYTFEVLPPWYQSVLAYVFYGLLILGIFFLFDRYQRQRILAKERRRNVERELVQAKKIEKAYAELKATQAQLIQSEKMASLGELTAGIAHEIQNPLNFVNNFSELNQELVDELNEELNNGDIEEAKAISKNIKENEAKINHHGKRADSIVKGMLQHSRKSSAEKEPTDINKLADEYLRLAYHGLRAKDKSFNASLETDFDDSVGKIKVFPQDMGRVILNLITNAFYACNEKKIAANDPEYKPTVSVSTKKEKNQIVISVKDNGNGIPQQVVDKIFQPFFTTKPSGEGTGLGLSMSYDIITKGHGGELQVVTNGGEGTIFTITIPNK